MKKTNVARALQGRVDDANGHGAVVGVLGFRRPFLYQEVGTSPFEERLKRQRVVLAV